MDILGTVSDQCYGVQQQLLVQTYTPADKQEMAHPAAIESSSSSNEKPNHTSTNKDGSSDQCNGNQTLSLAHGLSYLASLAHQKRDPMVPDQSYDSMKAKNSIYTDRDCSEIEQEWVEEYQEWLIIRLITGKVM